MKINTDLTQDQMIKEVDKYLKELGVNETILNLKTNKDKVLYYYNYIGVNVFRGVIELPNLYYIKLANLLCDTTERIKIFQEKFYNPNGNVAQQFRKYRRYLLDSRENSDEFLDVMDKMIKSQLWENLYSTIQQLFLEPFDEWIFDSMVDMIHNQRLDAQDIYFWFKSGRNIKSIISFSGDYIKSLQK